MAEELENQQEQFDKLSSAIETLQQTLQTVNSSVNKTAQELNTVTTKTQTLFNSTASSIDSFAKKLQSINTDSVKLSERTTRIYNKFLKDTSSVTSEALKGNPAGKIAKQLEQIKQSIGSEPISLFDLDDLELTDLFLERFVKQTELLQKNLTKDSLKLFNSDNLELTELFLDNFIKQQQQLKSGAGSQSIQLFDLDNLELTDLFLENIIKQKQQLKTYANSLNIELFELGNLDSTVRFLKDIQNLVTDIEGVTNKAATNLSDVQIGNLTPPVAPQRERTVQATPPVTPQRERTTQATPPVQPPLPNQNIAPDVASSLSSLTQGIQKLIDITQTSLQYTKEKDRRSYMGSFGGSSSPPNIKNTSDTGASLPPSRGLYFLGDDDLEQAYEYTSIVKDHLKSLELQVAQRNILNRLSNKAVSLALDLRTTSYDDLAAYGDIDQIQKKIIQNKKDQIALSLTGNTLVVEDAERAVYIAEAMEKQAETIQRNTQGLQAQLEVVKQIQGNANVKGFGFFSDLMQKIPGLSKLSQPFKDAEQAAKEAVAADMTRKKAAEAAKLANEELGNQQLKVQEEYNQKVADTRKKFESLTRAEKTSGEGLTKERLEALKLTHLTGESEGKEALKKIMGSKKFYKEEAAAKKASIDLTRKANDAVIEGAKKGSGALSAGFKALGPAIRTAIAPLGLIMLVVDAVKFIVDLFVTANKQTVGIARDLGVSKSAARGIREDFAEISRTSGETYVTIDNLIRAQKELNTELGRGGVMSESTLKAQLFLTERLKMSAAEAAKITARSEAFGESAEENIKSILNENKARYAAGKSIITQKQLLDGVSKVSGQIAASFGFSNKAIAEGIIKVHRYGLNLQQASQIANGLLDFETSISNELEAELLTGRTLNLERARMKALTGDIAGATEDVMSQMKGLTAEQRKSPIIMKAMAATIGLSVDELQDAYALENDRGRILTNQVEKAKQYEKYLREINNNTTLSNELKEEALQLKREDLGLDQASYAQIQATVTAQEQFDEALAKAKDLFAGLVNDGALDILTEAIKDFANWIGKLIGFSAQDKKTRDLLTEQGISTREATKLVRSYRDDKSNNQIVETLNKSKESLTAQLNTQGISKEESDSIKAKIAEIDKSIRITQGKTQTTKDLKQLRLGPGVTGASPFSQALVEQMKKDQESKKTSADASKTAANSIPKSNPTQVDSISNPTDTSQGQEVKIKPGGQESLGDFTIRSHPQDSLVMAGGTKFGEETNALLKELIAAVNKGGNVYMDGNKVGQSLMLSTSNLS